MEAHLFLNQTQPEIFEEFRKKVLNNMTSDKIILVISVSGCANQRDF